MQGQLRRRKKGVGKSVRGGGQMKIMDAEMVGIKKAIERGMKEC